MTYSTEDREADCPATPCEEWQGSIGRHGYGIKYLGKTGTTAHRWVWEQKYGKLDPVLQVMHLCHNRKCVNVEHLRPGTRSENMKQAGRLGRMGKRTQGETAGNAKLNEVAVRVIRQLHAEGRTKSDLASAYGVDPTNISLIVNRKTWRHVT